MDSNTGALLTLDSSGTPPKTRVSDAGAAQSFALRLIQNDDDRSKKRGAVRGLVDGNPPYRSSALKTAGRAEACNVNWGTGRAYLEAAIGAFYDLASEAPGVVAIQTSHKGSKPDDQTQWSAIMSAKADAIFNDPENDWDRERQQSIFEMVLHGCGPMFFENVDCVLPKSIHAGDLKMPERTPSTVKLWETAMVRWEYYPTQLFRFIEDKEAAKALGWDTEYTCRVIANAMGIEQPSTRAYDHEYVQDKVKENSLSYVADESKICPLEHLFWLEFDAQGNRGGITHAIIQADGAANLEPKYLFYHHERFDSFTQCVHPMYFDRGNGGWHYSVTGLGVKMFAAMAYQNRLMCNLMDKSFAPKVLFKFGSTSSSEKFTMQTYGDWGRIPAGTEVIQAPIQGLMQDGLAMFQASSDLMRSNLSAYQQQVATKQQGNPATARQVMLEASQQSSLSKTGINRYYAQLDCLYAEIIRRLCNLNSTDNRAKEFQKACMEEGVPKECFGRIESVRAVRVVGEGSPFLRKQALLDMKEIVPSLPEEGQQKWRNDLIAAYAGSASVSRYNPQAQQGKMADEQDWMLAEAIGLMRLGMAPPVTSSQNAPKFAAGLLQAATQAIASLQKGGNPMQVMQFLQLAGPAVVAHLKRFANDPLRKELFKALLEQWKKLAKLSDQLRKGLEQQAKQQQAQQGKTQAAMTDAQLAALKTKSDIAIKTARAKHAMAIKSATTRQNLALADARTSSEIMRNHRLSALQEQ